LWFVVDAVLFRRTGVNRNRAPIAEQRHKTQNDDSNRRQDVSDERSKQHCTTDDEYEQTISLKQNENNVQQLRGISPMRNDKSFSDSQTMALRYIP